MSITKVKKIAVTATFFANEGDPEIAATGGTNIEGHGGRKDARERILRLANPSALARAGGRIGQTAGGVLSARATREATRPKT